MQKLCVFLLLFMTAAWSSDAEREVTDHNRRVAARLAWIRDVERDVTDHHRQVAERFFEMIKDDCGYDPNVVVSEEVRDKIATVVRKLTLEENPAFAIFYNKEAWGEIRRFTPDLLRTEAGRAAAERLGVKLFDVYSEFRLFLGVAVNPNLSVSNLPLSLEWERSTSDLMVSENRAMPGDVCSHLHSMACAYDYPERAEDFFSRLDEE